MSRLPFVSVVVISYNDAQRLPRAIASVQRQTLRNLEIIVVDDASTDDTADVVRALAESDPRIRYERLPVNSGGCSAPRNRGLGLARAPWVMFCDSDDEYDRHACKNLLLAAERSDAEVACGAAERVDVRTGKVRPWRPELHESTRVVRSLAEFPDLLADTISVNKLYSRALIEREGIEFPEGLLFEDQLFTLAAMSSARGIAVIPEVVYRWYVDRLGEELSITQRRMESRNVDDRVEINRRIDAYLQQRGLADIQQVKDVKFLRHDLYVYLSAILDADDETAKMLVDHLRPYTEAIDPRRSWDVRPALRVAIYHLLLGDVEGVREAMRFVKWASTVDVQIVSRDDRQLWGCRHLDGGADVGGVPVDQWLDVTDLHLLDIPFTQRRYLHRVETFELDGTRLMATGSSVDYDGGLAQSDGLDLLFMVGPRKHALRVPGTWTQSSGRQRGWRVDGELTAELSRELDDRDWGAVSLAVQRGSLLNITPVRVGERPTGSFAFAGRVSRDGPDTVGLTAAENGGIGWKALRSKGKAPVQGEIRESFWRDELLVPLLSRLGSLLPAKRLVLVDTNYSRPSHAEFRAIAAALAEQHPDIEQAWVHRGRPTRVPESAQSVQRLSLRHHWLAARARWRFDDGTASLGVRHRRGGSVVFALDGVPIHRLGLDDPSLVSDRSRAKDLRRRARQWTTVLTPSDYGSQVVSSAFARTKAVTPTGLARMDRALATKGAAAREELRRALDLPDDRAIVLYAPVRRSRTRQEIESMIDLEMWAQRLGDRAYLLMRAQPGEWFRMSTRLRFAVRDISEPDDVWDYLAASDLLISDYAPAIADAAALGLPMALYQPDYETYVRRTHGLYVGLTSLGRASRTTSGLIDDVVAWCDDPAAWSQEFDAAVASFAAAHCGPMDGRSSQRAVAAIVGEKP